MAAAKLRLDGIDDMVHARLQRRYSDRIALCAEVLDVAHHQGGRRDDAGEMAGRMPRITCRSRSIG